MGGEKMTRQEALAQIKKFWTGQVREIPVFGKDIPACRYSEYAFILMNLPPFRVSILDAGVGASLLPAFLSSLGNTVVATDLWDANNKSIEGTCAEAFRIRQAWGFPYEICPTNLATLPFSDKHFDVVVCNSTIEHIPEDDDQDIKVVKELLRVSRELVFFTFPATEVPREYGNPDNLTKHPAERSYSFNTAIQRLVVPAIESGFIPVSASGMVDDGKLLLKRISA